MEEPNLVPPQEVSLHPVEIRDEDAITIEAALALAGDASFPLGKSTLQRWAKHWRGHPGGPRSVLVTTRAGAVYKLSREDFKAWVFEQKQNQRSHEAPQDPERPHKASRDPMGSQETSQDLGEVPPRLKELENENLQLKIDLGVRKQLLERARDEMDDLRSITNSLLRENGALQYQIHQLAPPQHRQDPQLGQRPDTKLSEPVSTQL